MKMVLGYPVRKCTQHVISLAIGYEGSRSFVAPRCLPWLLAGARLHFAKGSNYDQRTEGFVCPKCNRPFERKNHFIEHLRTCPEGYPFVLCSPECSTRQFFRISELVQHMETLDCGSDPNTPSRKSLIQGLKKKLKHPQEQQRLNKIRYELRSYVGRPDRVLGYKV